MEPGGRIMPPVMTALPPLSMSGGAFGSLGGSFAMIAPKDSCRVIDVQL